MLADRTRILVPTDPDWDPGSRDSMVEDLSPASAVRVLGWALRDFPPAHIAAPLVVGALWALHEAHPEPAALDVYAALLNLVRHEDEERPWSVGVWTPR